LAIAHRAAEVKERPAILPPMPTPMQTRRTWKSAVARCSSITANTATATAANEAISDFSYLTSLRKCADIATISNFSNLDKVQKARF
jgi:hypothetical protein